MVIDKDNIKILLFILIVGLGLGYAYINSDLNINGTARVDHANWDVHWANITITSGSVSGSNVVTQPTISNQTTVNYSVILSKPGDYYEFCVDAVNGGAIDAMIDGIDSKLNGATITTLPAYLNYTVTYSSGTPLEANHQLLANTTETYKVRLEYRTDINLNQIPATNQTLSLQFTVTYRQATDAAVPVVHRLNGTFYGTNLRPDVVIGSALPDGMEDYIYSTPEPAYAYMNNSNSEIRHFFKYVLVNDIVTEIYIGYKMNNDNNFYFIRGAGATYNSSTGEYNFDSPFYSSNKTILNNSFGSSNCNEYGDYYRCVEATSPRLAADIAKNGEISISNTGGWYAGVFPDGSAGYYD